MMKRIKRLGLLLCVSVLAITLAACNLPGAVPTSVVPTPTPPFVVGEKVNEVPLLATSAPTPTPIAPTPTILPEATTDKPSCGGQDVMRIVVLGIDQHAQADAIRWVYIDMINQKINVLSIPRDFWVTVYDMAPQGITQGRINATYGYGEYFNGEGKGIDSLQLNLEQNFGVEPDRYIVLYFDQIKTFIDIVGGIDITLPETVTDGSSIFRAGEHHMDGETAVIYMRMRYYDNDFFRVRRQSQVLTAFFRKAQAGLSPKQVFDLASKFMAEKSTLTNLAIDDLYALMCVAKNLDTSSVDFIEIPSSMYHGTVTSGGAQVLIPHREVPAFIQSVMDGTYIP